MKAIMISIKPEFVAKILKREKTIEIRKTKPLYLNPDTEVYIYCTKGPYIGHLSNRYVGKVVAKFTLNKVEEIRLNLAARFFTKSFIEKEILERSCLSQKELEDYLLVKGGCYNCLCGYAWHIDKLDVFHEPRELSSFLVKSHKVSGVDREGKEKTFTILKPIVRAPQSWCYVEELL